MDTLVYYSFKAAKFSKILSLCISLCILTESDINKHILSIFMTARILGGHVEKTSQIINPFHSSAYKEPTVHYENFAQNFLKYCMLVFQLLEPNLMQISVYLEDLWLKAYFSGAVCMEPT